MHKITKGKFLKNNDYLDLTSEKLENKMERENIAVGLDIGTTKIVAMIGKKNEYGKLEILGLGKSKKSWSCTWCG